VAGSRFLLPSSFALLFYLGKCADALAEHQVAMPILTSAEICGGFLQACGVSSVENNDEI
jgi:hypothetical protein